MKKCLSPNAESQKFPWVTNRNVSFKGYLYVSGELIKDESVLIYFEKIKTEKDFVETLCSLNGFFSVIVESENRIYAAVDRVTSTPLIYKVEDELWIGDDYKPFVKNEAQMEQLSLDQYLSSGYVYGEKTLLKNVFQLRAGSFLAYTKSNKNIKVENYYEYLPTRVIAESNTGSHLKRLDKVHNLVFGRLVKNLNGRKVVLPLSGGYDSRLILEMLLRFDYRNILCVTWGRESDWQVKIARDVASKFDVDWLCVDQKFLEWREWSEKNGLNEQLRCSGTITNIPYVQENVLVKLLQRKGLLKEDAVFLNGNSGDFIEGDHLPNALNGNERNEVIIDLIMQKHSRLAKLRNADLTRKEIDDQIDQFRLRNLDVRLFFEFWEWAERQSKFVTKCIKPFEKAGFEWRMPFWENEIMDFWANIPIDVKKKRSLYYAYFDRYMNQEALKPNGTVPFAKVLFERFYDQRFGVFFDSPLSPKRLFSNTKKAYPQLYLLDSGVRNENLITTKFNAILALTVADKIRVEILDN